MAGSGLALSSLGPGLGQNRVEALFHQTEAEGDLIAHVSRTVSGFRHSGIQEPG